MKNDGKFEAYFEWDLAARETVTNDQELSLWVSELGNQVGSEFQELVEETLLKVGRDAASLTKEQVKGLFQFLMQHPCAHAISEDWSEDVSPVYRGVGFKIGSAGKKKWGPDDKLYLDHPVLQKYLPRGLVFAVPRSTGHAHFQLVVFANRKFFGRRPGDDDDSDIVSPALLSTGAGGGPAAADDQSPAGGAASSPGGALPFDSFIETEKANGEACQIALLASAGDEDEGTGVWVIGSKNRKVVVRTLSDVAHYDGQPAYTYAVEMARCFFATLPDAEHQRAPLARFLRLTRLTLNFEFESPAHQHLVPLTRERLVMIGASGVHVGAAAAHPVFGFALARRFGFASVLDGAASSGRLAVRPRSDLERACTAIGGGWETEGSVLVLLAPGSRRVHDMIKVKSFWYVCLRAIREKLARLTGPAGVRRCAALIRARLRALRFSLAMPESVCNRFAELGVRFGVWLAQPGTGRLVDLRDRYPSLWLEFLRDHNLPTDSSLMDLSDGDLLERLPEATFSTVQAPLLVLMQGLPGLGKSLLAERLVAALTARSVSAVQVAQDDFVHLGHKKASSACLAHVRHLLEAGDHRVVILARNNANMMQAAKYINLDRREGLAKAVFLCPKELAVGAARAQLPALVYLCCASVMHRRLSGQQHPGTQDMEAEGLAALPLRFLAEFRPQPGALTFQALADHPGTRDAHAASSSYGWLHQWIPEQRALNSFVAHVFQNCPAVYGTVVKGNGHSAPKKQQSPSARGTGQTNEEPGWAAILKSVRLDNAKHCKTVCQQGHAAIARLVDQCVDPVIRASEADLPPISSYLAVRIDEATRQRLLDIGGGSVTPADKKSWTAHADHVTLVHSKSCLDSPAALEAWNRASHRNGQTVGVQFLRRYQSDSLEAVSVHLFELSGDSQSSSLDELVYSGAPHVTIRTAPGTKAFEAIDLVKQDSLAFDLPSGGPFECQGQIDLFESVQTM